MNVPDERDGLDLQYLSTCSRLLDRLRDGPEQSEAWSELVRLYGPHVYQWCLRWRMQPADAADLVQEVFTRLVRGMPRFRYDATRSFRAYLKSLARYACFDLQRQNLAPAASGGGGGRHDDELDHVVAREDLERRLEEEFDRELLAQAMTLVASRVAPTTWEAFRLQAVECVSAPEVARRLGMKIASVYKARSNVVKQLQSRLETLQNDDDSLEPANQDDDDSEIPRKP